VVYYFKRIYFLVVLFLILPAFVLGEPVKVAAGDSITSKTDAWNLVMSQILQGKIDGKWVYVSKEPVTAGSVIETWNGSFVFPYDSGWFFFIDDYPLANWEHPCRYVFVDQEKNILLLDGTTPPKKLGELERLSGFEISEKNKIDGFIPRSNFKSSLAATNQKVDHCYAVLISGGYDIYNNWIRYWNDMSFIYRTLTQVYGYRDDHIYVLMSDGDDPSDDRHGYDESTYWFDSSPLDLDGDGDNDVDYPATGTSITTVFNELQGTLKEDDYLFIFTTDHGGLDYDPEATPQDTVLYLWGDSIRDDQFAAEVNKISAGCEAISIMMEQCNSGGFVDDLIPGPQPRVIATAADATESSWAMEPDYLYDEFSYYWTSAMAGEDPFGTVINADTNRDGAVSMREAFNYAQSQDTAWETPQYSDSPANFGYRLKLLPVQVTGVGGEIQPPGKTGIIGLLIGFSFALILMASLSVLIIRRLKRKLEEGLL
jgi:hypothetical protein